MHIEYVDIVAGSRIFVANIVLRYCFINSSMVRLEDGVVKKNFSREYLTITINSISMDLVLLRPYTRYYVL